MKKLYTVTIEAEVVVVADDPETAIEAAEDARQDMSSYDWSFTPTPMRHYPHGWDPEAIPFGERADDEPDRTIDGWIKAGAGESLVKATADREALLAKVGVR